MLLMALFVLAQFFQSGGLLGIGWIMALFVLAQFFQSGGLLGIGWINSLVNITRAGSKGKWRS